MAVIVKGGVSFQGVVISSAVDSPTMQRMAQPRMAAAEEPETESPGMLSRLAQAIAAIPAKIVTTIVGDKSDDDDDDKSDD